MYMRIYRPFHLNSHHDIAGILLKVALNTIIRNHSPQFDPYGSFCNI